MVQVQGSAVEKYSSEFSCMRVSSSLHLRRKSGHSLEWLGCLDLGPQLTQQGVSRWERAAEVCSGFAQMEQTGEDAGQVALT